MEEEGQEEVEVVGEEVDHHLKVQAVEEEDKQQTC